MARARAKSTSPTRTVRLRRGGGGSAADELSPLVELSVDAFISVDENQHIVLFNAGAEAAFGYDRGEVLGEPLSMLMPERYRDKHGLDLVRFGESRTSARMMGDREGIVALRKDGSEFPAEASISSFMVGPERRYSVVLRDVSERRRDVERLMRGEEVIRRLYEIAADHGADLYSRLDGLLELGSGLLGTRTGIVARISGREYEVMAVWGGPADVYVGTTLDSDDTYCSKTVAAREPMGFARARGTEWERHPCYARSGEEAYLGAPVQVDGETFGTLSFTSLEPRAEPFADGERELVRLMALWVGREIEVQRKLEIDRLLAIGREALIGSFDFRETRAIVARLPLPTLAEASILYLPLGDRRVLRVDARDSSEVQEAEVGVEALRREEGQSHPPLDVLRKVGQGPRTLRLGGPGARPSGAGLEWLRNKGFASALVVPVAAQGTTIAAIALLSSKPSRYGPLERAVAAELATLAGFALAHGSARHASEAAVRARDNLLSFVSHDLGNPIATISMVTERLLDYPQDKDRRKDTRFYLEGIQDSAGRMERLVHDLLEVGLLEKGQRRIQTTPLKAESIVADVLRDFRHAAEAKSIELAGVAEEGAMVLADRDRLLEVLSNLVDNAVKFSSAEGAIRVTAEIVDRHVRFSVVDSGVGVPAEQISKLFDRHVQASRKRRAGAGLGLAIAKELVEQHGGSIWCESTLGEGALFRFTIPVS